MAADHNPSPAETMADSEIPKLSAMGRMRRIWTNLPTWEKVAAFTALGFIMVAGTAAATIQAPPTQKVVKRLVEKPAIVEVAVSDKWEDLGVYLKTQRKIANTVTNLEQQAIAKREAEQLDAMRAQLQSPGLPQKVQVVLRSKKQPRADVAVGDGEQTPKPAETLVSNKSQETIEMLEAFKVAIKEVGLTQDKTGFKTYKQ